MLLLLLPVAVAVVVVADQNEGRPPPSGNFRQLRLVTTYQPTFDAVVVVASVACIVVVHVCLSFCVVPFVGIVLLLL